jgi:hypothetical protein
MEAFLALVTDHQWPAAAVVVIHGLIRLMKSDTKFPITIPRRLRAWAALGLGACSGVLEAVVAGTPWRDALCGGAISALLAMGGHNLVVESILQGSELRVPGLMKKTTVLLFLWVLPACTPQGQPVIPTVPAGLKPLVTQYGPAATFAAQLLCADVYAKQRRISLEEAKDTVCAVADYVTPWISEVLRARTSGRSRAGLR